MYLVDNILFYQVIFVHGECSIKGIVPYSSLLEEPKETVSLPSDPADPNDVAGVMFSSDYVAAALYTGGITSMPKASQITNLGFQICLHNKG